jgi:hypothetical protein
LAANLNEFCKRDLALVVRMGNTFQMIKIFVPILFSDLNGHLLDVLNGCLNIHLLVEITKVLIVLHRLEAFAMAATFEVTLPWLVLTEIQTLLWKHIRTN